MSHLGNLSDLRERPNAAAAHIGGLLDHDQSRTRLVSVANITQGSRQIASRKEAHIGLDRPRLRSRQR